MANAVVYEVCSGSQPASSSTSLIVGIGAADSSLTGGTGQYRAPQVGDLLVVFVGSDNTSGTPNAGGVSDSKANTWTAIQSQVGAVNQQFRVFATVVAAGKALTGADTITATFATNAGTHHLIAKAIVGPASVTSSNGVTTQGSGGGTWSSGASGALAGTKVVAGFLQSAAAGGKPSALTFDAATATFTQAPSGHWSAFMVDTAPPGAGEAAGGTTASGTWAAGVVAWTAPTPVTGTGAVVAPGHPSVVLAGSGTYTAPVTATGAVAAKKPALAASGTYTAPVTGTGAVASRKPSLAGSGTYTGPYSGTGAFVAKKPALAAAGTFTPAPTTGSGSVHAKKPALAASGTYTPAPTTGTGSVAAKKITLAGAGTYTGPVTGTASVKSKKIALAGLGSYGAGITGLGALHAKKPALAGLGTYTPATITGTGSVVAKKIALAGTGAANIGPITGLGSIHAKKIMLDGSGDVGGAPAPAPLAVIAPSTLVPVIWDGLALNEGDRDDGLCTVATSVEGWYGSPPLAGNDLLRVLTDGAVYGYKTLGPRVVTITGGATGPRDLLNRFARNLAAKAAGRQPVVLLVGEDDGTDEPGLLAATVRADTDTLALAWQGRSFFTYQVAVTAGDPRLYESGWSTAVLSPLPSGAPTGRPYPFAPPRFYASADVANAAILDNPGNAPAPVFLTYTGQLAESRLTDGINTIHLTALVAAQQIFINSETLATTAPGGANRASYLMPGTVPMLIPPGASLPWYLYGTGAGTVQLAWRGAWT